MLSKELFIEMATAWKESHDEVNRMDEALSPFMDRPIITIGQGVRSALEKLILTCCGLSTDNDILWWWAFEDCDKTITISHRNGDVDVWDVSTLDKLYEYITEAGVEK